MEKDACLPPYASHKATLITATPTQSRGRCRTAITTGEIYNLFSGPPTFPVPNSKSELLRKGKGKQDERHRYLEGGIKVVVTGGSNAVGTEIEVVIQGGLDTGRRPGRVRQPRFCEVR